MIMCLRLGFIPRPRNDGKGIVYENGLGTFAHGVGIGHQSGAGVLHPDEGILAGIGVGLCLQHLCGYEGGRGEFHVLRELFFRQVQERTDTSLEKTFSQALHYIRRLIKDCKYHPHHIRSHTRKEEADYHHVKDQFGQGVINFIVKQISKFFKIMGETVEKIYCCDRDNNDNALAAAILANGNNRRDDWGPMAAMMGGGMNNWMNNPFAYLMFLALFRNGGFGFGGDGAGAGTATQGIETQAQLKRQMLNRFWLLLLKLKISLTKLLYCLQSLILCIRKSKKQNSVSARLRSPLVAWKNS